MLAMTICCRPLTARLIGAVAAALGTCGRQRWTGRSGPPGHQAGTMPGSIVGGQGMRCYVRGMRSGGPRMPGGNGPGARLRAWHARTMLRHRQAMMHGMPGSAGALSERGRWRIIRFRRTL